jgi:hypothetical protein
VTAIASTAFLFQASVAHAQTSTMTATDVPDRLVISGGFFGVQASTNVVLNATSTLGTTISFEKDLNLPANSNSGFFDVAWRFAKRHRLSLNVNHINRTGAGVALTKDIVFGDQTFTAGVSAVGRLDSTFVAGVYRFALYRNSRFEIGPGFGGGLLKLTAGIDAAASLVGGGRSTSGEGTSNSITGDIGVYGKYWVAKRVEILGDARYIYVSPGHTQQSVTEARIGATWYFAQHWGVGAQYVYDKFRSDVASDSARLGFRYRYDGVQVLGAFAF